MEIDDPTLQRLRQLLAPDFRRQQSVRVLPSAVFPGNVADGTSVRYKALATATGALLDAWWEFTFDASDTYWYFSGGDPLFGYSAGSIASSVATTWQQTATPAIVVPFAGDYDVYAASLVGQSVAAANCAVGPATAATPTPPSGNGIANFIANETQSLDWRSAFTVPAGTDFRHSQWTNDATPGHTATTGRTLIVRPLRCR